MAKWTSAREREVALALGARVRDSRVEQIDMDRTEGNSVVICGVRPATPTEEHMWFLLVTPEKKWFE